MAHRGKVNTIASAVVRACIWVQFVRLHVSTHTHTPHTHPSPHITHTFILPHASTCSWYSTMPHVLSCDALFFLLPAKRVQVLRALRCFSCGVFATCAPRRTLPPPLPLLPHPALPTAQAFVATGGEDGRLCLWSRRTRELLLQFSEHVKPVLQLTLDVQSPSRVHTVGADRSVYTVDLKSERRVVAHQVRLVCVRGGGHRDNGTCVTLCC